MKRRSGAVSPLCACALQKFIQTFFVLYLAVLCLLGKQLGSCPGMYGTGMCQDLESMFSAGHC